MSLTQFAMVEELAFLVKDNLSCKHLVLSMEETLIDFLKDDESSNVTLELEPMNPYNRLLLHRLADIFGFFHHSVGEGDGRHLVFERCSETSIPSILVSDFLWQYDDEHRSLASSQTVLRGEASQVNEVKPNSHISIEERESAYLAARQRIFAAGEGGADEPLKQKPPSNPVVARRMIAHALGKRIKAPGEVTGNNNKEYREHIDEINIQARTVAATNSELDTFKDGQIQSTRRYIRGKPEVVEYEGSALSDGNSEVTTKQAEILGTKINNFGISEVQKANLKKEQTGAAKRMFANALGYHSGRENSLLKCSERKHNNKESSVSVSR